MRNVYDQPITAEEKAVWLRALRSGKYKQALHELKKDNDHQVGYCCLGVACEVFGPGFQDSTFEDNPSYPPADFEAGNEEYYEHYTDQWPGLVWEASEAQAEDKTKRPECEAQKHVLDNAIKMNDTGKDFFEIADYLEENLVPVG